MLLFVSLNLIICYILSDDLLKNEYAHTFLFNLKIQDNIYSLEWNILEHINNQIGGAHGVMVIVVGNRHGD